MKADKHIFSQPIATTLVGAAPATGAAPVASSPAPTRAEAKKLGFALLKSISHLNVVESKRLVAAGADLSVVSDDGGKRPLAEACDLKLQAVAIEIANTDGVNLEAEDILGRTPLIIACYNSLGPVVSFLLKKGANANAKTKFPFPSSSRDGETALMVASEKGDSRIVADLLANGADINAETEAGITALYQAVDSYKSDVALQLIAAGANVNKGKPALCAPALMEDVKRALLRAGAVDPFAPPQSR